MLGALAEGVFEASKSPARERRYGSLGGKRLHAPGGHLPSSASPPTVLYSLFRCLPSVFMFKHRSKHRMVKHNSWWGRWPKSGELAQLAQLGHPARPVLTLEPRLANHAAATPCALRRRQRSCPGHAAAWLPSIRRLRARTAARCCSEHSPRTRSTVSVEHQICSASTPRVDRCRLRVTHASPASVASAWARGACLAKPSRPPLARSCHTRSDP